MIRELGADPVASDLPGYEILGPAGKGSMGRVFVARQTALGRLVAVKFLSIDHEADPCERLARFRREAEIMAALSHPNVVPVHDFGEVDGHPYLVMEYVEGGDLRRKMSESGPMSPASALLTLGPIGEALDYLHARGILHRDLKPENILMQGDIPKVADFGIAVERTGSGELTRSDQGLGTLGYVAPEQQYRLPVDERADQYSLAAMTYEMLTGQRPLGVFKPPSRHNPDATEAVDRVILRALEEDPKDRFGSVVGFVAALREAIEAKGPGAAPVPRPRTRWSSLAGSAIVAALALAVAWVAIAGPRAEFPLASDATIALPTWPRDGSPAFEELTRRKSEAIWRFQGEPKGDEGEAVRERNWYRAQDQLRVDLANVAARLWCSRSRSGPPFDADEVGRVWNEAQRELLERGTAALARPAMEGR